MRDCVSNLKQKQSVYIESFSVRMIQLDYDSYLYIAALYEMYQPASDW